MRRNCDSSEKIQAASDEKWETIRTDRLTLLRINVAKKRKMDRTPQLVVKKRRMDEGRVKTVYSKLRVDGSPFARTLREPPLPFFDGYLCGFCKDVQWRGETGWYYLKNKNEWYCPPCGLAFGRKHACPICGLCFSEDDSDEDAANWIQCDVCSRWIMTICDGIEDIHVGGSLQLGEAELPLAKSLGIPPHTRIYHGQRIARR